MKTSIALPLTISLLALSSLAAAAPQRAVQSPRQEAAAPVPCEPRIPITAGTTPGDGNSLYRIDKPGSYYLPGNVTVPAGLSGIEIASDAVTIDLMGFQLEGKPGSIHGFSTDGAVSHPRIHNGTVARFGQNGLGLGGAKGATATSISVVENGAVGLHFSSSGVVDRCLATQNAEEGIFLGTGGRVSNSTATNNGAAGFYVLQFGNVHSCLSMSNRTGFRFGAGSFAELCIAFNNDTNGFNLHQGARALRCEANSNDESGFWAGSPGVEITECKARYNGLYGFQVKDRCVLRDNFALENGSLALGGGFYVLGEGNKLENNFAQDHEFLGYGVAHAGNFLRGNIATDNGLNWSVLAGNACRVVMATASPGFAGDSGGNSVGPYDPAANYTY